MYLKGKKIDNIVLHESGAVRALLAIFNDPMIR